MKDVFIKHPQFKQEISTKENEIFFSAIEDITDNLINLWDEADSCKEYLGYKFPDFKKYSENIFRNIIEKRFYENNLQIPGKIVEKVKLAVFNILRAKEDVTNYTGLIFAGFGEKEIYPQLITLNISMVIEDRLRYHVDEERGVSISNENDGAIRPFAQTDVIDTILSGIDPTLDELYLENFEKLFGLYNKQIVDNIGDENPLLKEQIKKLDIKKITDKFRELNNRIRRDGHIIPLMEAVSHLDREDLAEMAESLIYLTYLKRRITFAEESVGGPVDVAIITKGDGFIWMKRKHFFNPELNPHFFKNYFKL